MQPFNRFPPGLSQSTDSNGRALPDLPQLDPNRIRFAHRNSLAGILYVLAIPASLLVVWFFTALLVNFLDSPGRYAPNGAVAGAGGLLSGAIKVCFFAGVVLISGFFWRQVKASFQTSSDERILSDARLPVLYLRPFGADSKAGFLDQAPRAEMTSFRYLRHLFRTSSSSEEGELVQTLEQSGPVLAIGRPSEKIPPLGAARIYVEDSEWQDFVRVLTYYARTIFVRVGDTSGFQWELQHLRRDCDPLKILVFFPATSPRQRNATLSVVQKELRVSLEERWGPPIGSRKDLWYGHVTPFLFAFTKDWEPIDIMDSGEKPKDWESLDVMDLVEKLKDSEPSEITHSAENLVRSLKAYLGELPVPPQSLRDGWAAVHRDLVSADEQTCGRMVRT